jgi:hypothetical protein
MPIPTITLPAFLTLFGDGAPRRGGDPRGDYATPNDRPILLALARQEHPDTSAYADPELVWRLDKYHHVGFVVRAATPERVSEVITSLVERVTRESAHYPAEKTKQFLMDSKLPDARCAARCSLV